MIKLAFGPMALRMAFLRVFGYGMKWKGSLFEYILFTNAEKKRVQAWRDVDADKILGDGKPKSGALVIRLEIR
jgi:hypothetical protein